MNQAQKKDRPVKLGAEEKRYLLLVVLAACLIYLFRREIQAFSWLVSLALPGILLSIVLFKVLSGNGSLREVFGEQLTLVPFIRAEGEKKFVVPKATILFILVNVLVHYSLQNVSPVRQEFVYKAFCFLPRTRSWWSLILSPVSSLFLHADSGHLWGNMLFLWAFGPAVEERVGTKKFIFLYFFTGVIGGLTAVFIQSGVLRSALHGIGASGAISGIMGVFMVRCYFKRLVIPLPIFGLVHYRLRVNSLVPLLYFFLLDVRGGTGQLAGSDSNIGYWAHIGSLLAGVALAMASRQHLQAAREKYTAIGLDAMEKPNFYKDGVGALNRALELDPQNDTALLALARHNAIGRKPEGKEQFEKVIAARLKKDPREAADLYREYMTAYNRALSPLLQYRLAGILYRLRDLHGAMRALEMLVDGPGADAQTREQAFSQLVGILSEAGFHDPARHRLEQFAAAFPGSLPLKLLREKFKVGSGDNP